MRWLLLSTILFSNFIISKISLSDLDFLTSLSNSNSLSMIESGTKHCNQHFNSNKQNTTDSKKFENTFFCKFSNSRNRFYIYMLSQHKNKGIGVRDYCENLIKTKEEISDHLDKSFSYQDKKYLQGFYIENIFNDSVVNFSSNFQQNQLVLNNEINKFITLKRSEFTSDNKTNNEILEKEILRLNKIYKKSINKEFSDLDRITKVELNKIVRYKIFINDIQNFKSYSCTWSPGKGLRPYVKKEKFSEFENI